jgi:hypothetical protein
MDRTMTGTRINQDRFCDIRKFCAGFEPVGSRVTCNPPPNENDEDFLLLPVDGHLFALLAMLDEGGWVRGGSNIPNEANTTPIDGRFHSYRYDAVNLIIAETPEFFRRFMAATAVCKRLNLLDKADRITVFQAVLYGNGGEATALPALEEEVAF